MPIILKKHSTPQRSMLRDTRPVSVRMVESLEQPGSIAAAAVIFTVLFLQDLPYLTANNDILAIFAIWYFRWLLKRAFLTAVQTSSTRKFSGPK